MMPPMLPQRYSKYDKLSCWLSACFGGPSLRPSKYYYGRPYLYPSQSCCGGADHPSIPLNITVLSKYYCWTIPINIVVGGGHFSGEVSDQPIRRPQGSIPKACRHMLPCSEPSSRCSELAYQARHNRNAYLSMTGKAPSLAGKAYPPIALKPMLRASLCIQGVPTCLSIPS